MNLEEMITKQFADNEELSNLDIQLIKHGIDIILCDTGGMAGMLLLSQCFHTTMETLIYIIIFSALRIHSGGIHANKKITCFLTTQMIYLMFVLSYRYLHINDLFLICIFISSLVFTWISAPVVHHLQPLTDVEIKDNRMQCHIILIVISICYIFLSDFRYIFTYVSFINAVMMLLLQLQEKRMQDGNQSFDH